MIRLSAFADEISPDPLEQIDVLERNGIKHIEFRAIHGTNVLDLADSKHHAFRRLVQDRGFGLSAIGSPIGKVPITEPFGPHLDRFERAMDLAEFYGTPNIRVFSYYMPENESPETYGGEVIERMRRKAELAAARGLRLVLENEKGIYGDVPERVLGLLESVNSTALGHAFDPANYLECGQSVDHAWDLLQSRLAHFHVKDYSTKERKNVPAGQGDGQIPRLLAEAVAEGYTGFAVLEPHLVVAEKSHGFTGPEMFAVAANALKTSLDEFEVPYA